MKKLSALLLCCCFLFSAHAQWKLSGKMYDDDEKPIQEVLIKVTVKETGEQLYIVAKEDYYTYLKLHPGTFTLQFSSHLFFTVEKEIVVTEAKSISLDVNFVRITMESIAQKIPPGKLPEKLLGEWTVVAVQKKGERRRGVRNAKLKVTLSKHYLGFGILECYSACRGLKYSQYFQISAEQNIQFHEDYQDILHTTELRRCDQKHLQQKESVQQVLWSYQDQAKAFYQQSRNQRKLQIEHQGHLLLLKKK